MNPLDQLADIATPTNVPLWPLAIGYWIMLAVVICMVVYSTMALLEIRKRGAAKRKALKQLKELDTHDPYFVHKTQVILKTTFAQYISLNKAAKGYGKQWQDQLVESYNGKHKESIQQASEYLFSHIYMANSTHDIDASQVKQAVEDWLKNIDTKTYGKQLGLSENKVMGVN